MKAIITKFIPCTDTKGSRIKASTGTGGQSIMISYPHELNADEAHLSAAQALCDKMKWSRKLIQGGLETGESVFVFEPPTHAATLQALRNMVRLFQSGEHHTIGNPYCNETILAALDTIKDATGFTGDRMDANNKP